MNSRDRATLVQMIKEAQMAVVSKVIIPEIRKLMWISDEKAREMEDFFAEILQDHSIPEWFPSDIYDRYFNVLKKHFLVDSTCLHCLPEWAPCQLTYFAFRHDFVARQNPMGMDICQYWAWMKFNFQLAPSDAVAGVDAILNGDYYDYDKVFRDRSLILGRMIRIHEGLPVTVTTMGSLFLALHFYAQNTEMTGRTSLKEIFKMFRWDRFFIDLNWSSHNVIISRDPPLDPTPEEEAIAE